MRARSPKKRKLPSACCWNVSWAVCVVVVPAQGIVAQHLASLIGGVRTDGQVMATSFHNDKNAKFGSTEQKALEVIRDVLSYDLVVDATASAAVLETLIREDVAGPTLVRCEMTDAGRIGYLEVVLPVGKVGRKRAGRRSGACGQEGVGSGAIPNAWRTEPARLSLLKTTKRPRKHRVFGDAVIPS